MLYQVAEALSLFGVLTFQKRARPLRTSFSHSSLVGAGFVWVDSSLIWYCTVTV